MESCSGTLRCGGTMDWNTGRCLNGRYKRLPERDEAYQPPKSTRHTQCQPGTSVHRVYVNCISHVTLCHLLTHLGCVYNRSM